MEISTMREYNVYAMTKLNKIFLESAMTHNVQQAKLSVMNNLNTKSILETLKSEQISYSIIVELSDTQIILK